MRKKQVQVDKKMPVSSDLQRRLGANVRTLHDLNSFHADPSSSNHYDASYSNNNSNNHPRKGNAHDPAAAAAASVPMSIHHIPHLPNADQALGMLQRLHKEFYPIVVRRGYKVLSLSEMCCCGDGQDNTNNKNNNNRRTNKSGRTTRMNQNVLGYNQGRSNGTNTHHRIHIRLRETTSNKSSAAGADHTTFYSYEHVAGTMSHELAHCDVGPHNVKFYKLMDDIQEQHAVFLTNRVVTDGSGFPLNSPQAHVLGSGGNAARTSSNRTGAAAQAAIQRQHKRNQRRNTCTCLPQKLGGNSKMAQWMLPGQAAAMAAETRCLQDEQWCQSWHPIHPNVNHTIVGKRARPNQNYPPIALGNTTTTMTATKRKATATTLTIDTATAAMNAATGRRNAEGFLATPFAETINLTC